MSEVRPSVGSYISIARFQLIRDVKLVNFTGSEFSFPFDFNEFDPEKRVEDVWAILNTIFSVPVAEPDQTTDYVPTQIISEIFKQAGYDGLIYNSGLGPGHNIALFDIDSAKLINRELYTAKAVTFEFTPCSAKGGEGGDAG